MTESLNLRKEQQNSLNLMRENKLKKGTEPRSLWDNKRSICIISTPGRKEKWSESRRVFKEIMARNFPELVKVKSIQV